AATTADFGCNYDDSCDGGDRSWAGFTPVMAATAWGVEPVEGRQRARARDSSMEPHFPMAKVHKCIKIGLICMQERPEDRPTMVSVVLILESDTASVAMRGNFEGSCHRARGIPAPLTMLQLRYLKAGSIKQSSKQKISMSDR
ncbi:hypothetical protein Taro_007173, partial [Colocasia esculenta]|nr:hypothetical protein [Colocasia esculenta]